LQASHGDLSALAGDVKQAAAAWTEAPQLGGLHIVFNVPAFLIVMLLTLILVLGIRESAWFNSAMVAVKLVIILFFLAVGAFYVQPENWSPFRTHGFQRHFQRRGDYLFCLYRIRCGHDRRRRNPRPAAQHADRDPGQSGGLHRRVHRGGRGADRDVEVNRTGDGGAAGDGLFGAGINWAAGIVAFGAVVATTSVLFVFQLGQPRIFFCMARDRLLPDWAAKVHPRFRTPYVTTILTGVLVAGFAGVSNINEVVELCNIGTLFAFLLVAAGILVLRRTDPTRARPFRTPLVPWCPLGPSSPARG